MNSAVSAADAAGGLTGIWHLDPARSSVEFHVRHFYGLMTVKGRFDRYQGTLDGGALKVRGILYAAGKHIPIALEATITPVGDGFEIEATGLADHRELGMLWSPMGIMRAPSKLIVRGRLLRAELPR